MRSITTWLSVVAMIFFGAVTLAADSFDSDGDGYDDNHDNCTLVFNPLQRDTDGDHFGNMCDGDFDGNFVVNFVDLAFMKANFFAAGDTVTDLDGDGATNFADLGLLKSLFFTNPGPTATDPDMPPCTCYFSPDCGPDGGFCDYGGPYTQETNCFWRDGKPDAILNGCSTELELDEWLPNICDGVCSAARNGSANGLEDKALVGQAVELWSQAIVEPTIYGGETVDAAIAEIAMNVPFNSPNISESLGRHTADLVALVAGEEFHGYFCHWEGHPGEPGPLVSIAGDTCRIRAVELTVDGLVAEMDNPGSAAAYIGEIASVCPDWQTRFEPRCAAGPEALQCVSKFVEELAYFLTTPPINSVPEALDRLLRAPRSQGSAR